MIPTSRTNSEEDRVQRSERLLSLSQKYQSNAGSSGSGGGFGLAKPPPGGPPIAGTYSTGSTTVGPPPPPRPPPTPSSGFINSSSISGASTNNNKSTSALRNVETSYTKVISSSGPTGISPFTRQAGAALRSGGRTEEPVPGIGPPIRPQLGMSNDREDAASTNTPSLYQNNHHPTIDHSPKVNRTTFMPPISSPIVYSKNTAASVTAAAVNSPGRGMGVAHKNDSTAAVLARRLENTFTANYSTTSATSPSPDMSRSKSAPPSRPPPPGPPPLAAEEPAMRTVSFQGMDSNGLTPKPGPPPPRYAANTPRPVKQQPTRIHLDGVDGSATPFSPNPTVEAPVSTGSSTSRRDMLRNMREMADTPLKSPTPNGTTGADTTPVPAVSGKSPELRLHEILATTEKERASALRQVAELQDEITKIKISTSMSSHVKTVGFHSPASHLLNSPGINHALTFHRRAPTPFRKHRDTKSATAGAVDVPDRYALIEAVKMIQYEYYGDGTTYVVRRPYECATEAELWFKAGQLNGKRYAHAADVVNASSLEIVVHIEADMSILLLFRDDEVRHTMLSGVSTEYGNVGDRPMDECLGRVSYIDKEANEKEYSLDELFRYADFVRNSYCNTIISVAGSSRNQQVNLSESSPIAKNLTKTGPVMPIRSVQTSEKAVATDFEAVIDRKQGPPQQKEAKSNKPPLPPEEAPGVGVIGTFIGFLSSLFWFVCVVLPMRVLKTTFVLTVSVVLMAHLWLYLADDNGAGAMRATAYAFSNRPDTGIV